MAVDIVVAAAEVGHIAVVAEVVVLAVEVAAQHHQAFRELIEPVDLENPT